MTFKTGAISKRIPTTRVFVISLWLRRDIASPEKFFLEQIRIHAMLVHLANSLQVLEIQMQVLSSERGNC